MVPHLLKSLLVLETIVSFNIVERKKLKVRGDRSLPVPGYMYWDSSPFSVNYWDSEMFTRSSYRRAAEEVQRQVDRSVYAEQMSQARREAEELIRLEEARAASRERIRRTPTLQQRADSLQMLTGYRESEEPQVPEEDTGTIWSRMMSVFRD